MEAFTQQVTGCLTIASSIVNYCTIVNMFGEKFSRITTKSPVASEKVPSSTSVEEER